MMNTLGKRLKAARKNKGFTQQELEKRSGVSQQLISRIESEKIDNTTEVFNLAEVLDVNAKWLATGNGDMSVESVAITETYSKEDLDLLRVMKRVTAKQKNDAIRTLEKYAEDNQAVIDELISRQTNQRKVA